MYRGWTQTDYQNKHYNINQKEEETLDDRGRGGGTNFILRINKTYQCIRQKTGAQNIVKEIKQYQEKWLQHVQRMDTNRLPKQALQYNPKGRRNIGRPRKRWRDQLHLEDQQTIPMY